MRPYIININFMNKLFLFLVAIVICTSCTSKEGYSIIGTAPADFDGQKVYLIPQRENGMGSTIETEIKGGKFSFTGLQEMSTIYVLRLGKGSNDPAHQAILLAEPGKITVNITADGIRIGGTPVNEAYQKKNDAESVFHEKMGALEQKYAKVNPATLSEEERERINDEFMEVFDAIKNLNINFVRDNINNPLGEGLFFALINQNQFSLEDIDLIISNAGDKFKSNDTVKAIIGMINETKKVAVGQKFVDFTMQDPSGKEISLSDFAGKGKYVLIDFWASWCGPCIKEMPTLVEAYGRYKGKNFEIVGVSLDDKNGASQWKAAIKRYNMTWPQMSDLQKWDSQARILYGFNSIPHTVLLDPNGIIIAKDLRGKKLLDKLAVLIK